MALIYNRPEFAPANLTTFARGVLAETDVDALASIFPNTSIDSLTYTWTNNGRSHDEAIYRAVGAETKIGRGPAEGQTVTGRLFHLGLKLQYSEDDALEAAVGGVSKQQKIDELAGEVTMAIIRKQQRMRAEALVTGRLVIRERGFSQETDFERDASLTTTADQLWSNPDSDPVEFIASLIEHAGELSDAEFNQFLVSRQVMGALRKNNEIKAQVGALGARASDEQIRGLFAENGLPTPSVYSSRLNGEAVLPADHIFLASSNAGATLYGPTSAASNPASQLDDPRGIFVGAYEDFDSDNIWVKSDATALPILGNANGTAAIKVL